MKPTVGRIVHYQSYGTPGGEYKPQPRAAIITDVRIDPPLAAGPHDRADNAEEIDYQVRLFIANPDGVFFSPWLNYSPDAKPGTWRWPPRE
jgi:hypothetical protein